MLTQVSIPTGLSLTAEMVADGHPDKFCDQVADSILDHAIKQDPESRVAIECLAKNDLLVISGEMTSKAAIQRRTVGEEYLDTTWLRRSRRFGSG